MNVAGGARCDYICVGEEVGVHIDELLVRVGDAHTGTIVGCKLRARNAVHVRARGQRRNANCANQLMLHAISTLN